MTLTTHFLVITFTVFGFLTVAGHSVASPNVILDPIPDAKLSAVLQSHFTLPLVLGVLDQSEAERRAAIDTEAQKLTSLLRSYGYRDGKVKIVKPSGTDKPTRLRAMPGVLYRLGWIRVDGLPADVPSDLSRALNEFLESNIGQDATAQAFDAINGGVRWNLREASYAKATVSPPLLKMETETRTVGVVIKVEIGPRVRLGKVKFEGSGRMKPSDAAKFVPFSNGAPYSLSAIESLRSALEQTNSFRRIQISLSDQANAAGQFDLNVELRDGPGDPGTLKRSSGFGPLLVFATMLLIVFRECTRATRHWKNATFRHSLTGAVFLMVTASGVVILQRIVGFLA